MYLTKGPCVRQVDYLAKNRMESIYRAVKVDLRRINPLQKF